MRESRKLLVDDLEEIHRNHLFIKLGNWIIIGNNTCLLINCHSKCCLLVLPDKIQSISAPYFLRGCCGDWSELVRPPLLRDFSELFLAPLPYCRIADAGICRLYSTSPSWVILGSWRRERRAYKTLNVVRSISFVSKCITSKARGKQ